MKRAILATLLLCLCGGAGAGAAAAPASDDPPRFVLRVTHSIAHSIKHAARAYLVSTARVCTARGRCARVLASAAHAFEATFREFEGMGYALGSPGCLSGGHMHRSKHHDGRACDLFNQVARNRTALRQPPADVQIEVASRHGLISGCQWHGRQGPDCGHFEVPGRLAAR